MAPAPLAIVMTVKADRVIFFECRFLLFLDTLLDKIGCRYYHKCYIKEGTDFIYGNGKALFEIS
nr:unnamed protein product [Digitaria exilis]